MNVVTFNTTHINLLKEQEITNQLLNELKSLVIKSQINTPNIVIKKLKIRQTSLNHHTQYSTETSRSKGNSSKNENSTTNRVQLKNRVVM